MRIIFTTIYSKVLSNISPCSMLKYFISCLFIYPGLIWAQIVNPVTISLDSEAAGRAGEVINIHVDANMDNQWKIYSIYKIIVFYAKF